MEKAVEKFDGKEMNGRKIELTIAEDDSRSGSRLVKILLEIRGYNLKPMEIRLRYRRFH